MNWIAFVETPKPSRRTRRWQIVPTAGGSAIGLVQWYAPWRKYALFPFPNTVFEEDCLREIAQFCQQNTRNHKNPRMAADT